MIVDANLLLYAVDENSAHNPAAAAWLEEVLDGDSRVGLPWQSIGAFLRIVTHPRVAENPLSGPDAWRYVAQWLAVPVVWIPPATGDHSPGLRNCAEKSRSRAISCRMRNWSLSRLSTSRISLCRHRFHAVPRTSLVQPTQRMAGGVAVSSVTSSGPCRQCRRAEGQEGSTGPAMRSR